MTQPSARDIAETLGALVAAIGGPHFADRFRDAMHVMTGAELCSVFRCDERGRMALVFASGDAGPADFPVRASRAYANGYWRSDRQLTRMTRSALKRPIVVRRRASDIADPAYRAACYDSAGVVERLSLLSPMPPAQVINGYRTGTSAPFDAADIERLEMHAGLLIGALGQHERAGSTTGLLFDPATLTERLVALDCGLSAREAEIVAAMILGGTQQNIADATHLSPATVVTYRRRAYGKLGIARRRDLLALHRRLMADAPAAYFDDKAANGRHQGE